MQTLTVSVVTSKNSSRRVTEEYERLRVIDLCRLLRVFSGFDSYEAELAEVIDRFNAFTDKGVIRFQLSVNLRERNPIFIFTDNE
jgi:DNA polymerase IIIc chi subunit